MQDIEQLAVALYDAKRAEDEAKKKRIDIEMQIVAIVDGPDSGSQTVQAGALKVTVKRGFNYKADTQAILALGLADPPLKTKIELDKTAYERIRKDDSALFDRISTFVEVTPAKPAVTINLA
ncbi:MAG TPA: hypothetical protein GXZ51_04845 [Acholeplasma sp.]|jgi:hypothetical protein|nr:hypothetical protein [Acholeplasma sp.]